MPSFLPMTQLFQAFVQNEQDSSDQLNVSAIHNNSIETIASDPALHLASVIFVKEPMLSHVANDLRIESVASDPALHLASVLSIKEPMRNQLSNVNASELETIMHLNRNIPAQPSYTGHVIHARHIQAFVTFHAEDFQFWMNKASVDHTFVELEPLDQGYRDSRCSCFMQAPVTDLVYS